MDINFIYKTLSASIDKYKTNEGNLNVGCYCMTKAAFFRFDGLTPLFINVIDEINIKNGGESILSYIPMHQQANSILGFAIDGEKCTVPPEVKFTESDLSYFIELMESLIFKGIDQLSWMQMVTGIVYHEQSTLINGCLVERLEKISSSKYFTSYQEH